MDEQLAISPGDVSGAAITIAGDIVATPTLPSRTLSALTGAVIFVKFENLQFTASFKDRGSANRLHHLDADQRRRGVIAVSAGNHAQGVAHHAGRMGIPATIVMPETAPYSKVVQTSRLGAEVVQHGATFADAAAHAHSLVAERGLVEIPPYDDPLVMAGQGTVALEMLDAVPDLDVILVPVGGGGLIAGMATAVAGSGSATEVVGVQSETYPSMIRALAGEEFTSSSTGTIADGIAVKSPGVLTLPIVERHVHDMIAVSEEAIEDAVRLYIEIEKTVAEGAGAITLGAVLEDRGRFEGRRVGLVLSGGNIDTRLLTSVLMRGLGRTGRLTPLQIDLDDLPGRLAAVATVIGDAGANIVEVEHRRMFGPLSARSTTLDVVVETRDGHHADEVVERLRAAGLPTRRLSP
jgi:threonine dehydratase